MSDEEELKADTSGITASSGNPADAEGEYNNLSGKPRMGLTATTLNVTNGQLPNGAYVLSVNEGSPAAQAGIQPGDTIVEANGQIITSVSELTAMISGMKEGDQLQVKVFRPDTVEDAENVRISTSGDYMDLTLTLAIVDAIAR